jgi:hypothetical protein
MRVVILDVETGRKQREKEWATPYDPVRFYGLSDGGALVCTGNVLRLFSANLELVREQELPSKSACANPALPVQRGISPSGRTLLLGALSGSDREMTLVDVDTFAVFSQWSEEGWTTGAVSDHWLVGYCGERRDVCLRKISEPWQPFHPLGLSRQIIEARRGPTSFLSDETLLVEGGNSLAAVTTQGAILFQTSLPQNHVFGWPVVSAGGERFAVIDERFRGLRSEPLDMYPFPADDHALVYSIPHRRAIYAVKLKGTSPWSPWTVHDNELALSPDGALLGVLSDGVLRVYRVPGTH